MKALREHGGGAQSPNDEQVWSNDVFSDQDRSAVERGSVTSVRRSPTQCNSTSRHRDPATHDAGPAAVSGTTGHPCAPTFHFRHVRKLPGWPPLASSGNSRLQMPATPKISYWQLIQNLPDLGTPSRQERATGTRPSVLEMVARSAGPVAL